MTIPIYLEPLLRYQSISNIWPTILLTENALEQSTIDTLRGELLRALDKQTIIKNQGFSCFNYVKNLFFSFTSKEELRDILIFALQGLAHDFPLEDVDPIDFEPIGNDAYFLSLTGRKYRLSSLLPWIHSRNDFILPDNNTPMMIEDIQALKKLCKENTLSLTFIKEPIPSILPMDLSIEDISPNVIERFHVNHISAIQMLQNRGLHLNDALKEVRGLNPDQSDALFRLYTEDLRGSDLRKLDAKEFGPHHTVVLILLIKDWEYSINEAIHAISGCDFDEVQKFYGMTKPNNYSI